MCLVHVAFVSPHVPFPFPAVAIYLFRFEKNEIREKMEKKSVVFRPKVLRVVTAKQQKHVCNLQPISKWSHRARQFHFVIVIVAFRFRRPALAPQHIHARKHTTLGGVEFSSFEILFFVLPLEGSMSHEGNEVINEWLC